MVKLKQNKQIEIFCHHPVYAIILADLEGHKPNLCLTLGFPPLPTLSRSAGAGRLSALLGDSYESTEGSVTSEKKKDSPTHIFHFSIPTLNSHTGHFTEHIKHIKNENPVSSWETWSLDSPLNFLRDWICHFHQKQQQQRRRLCSLVSWCCGREYACARYRNYCAGKNNLDLVRLPSSKKKKRKVYNR